MHSTPTIFLGEAEQYQADTCEPLLAAARAKQLRFAAAVHGAYPGARMRRDILPELCSAGSWDAPRDQSWGLNWHRNEGIEFTFLFSGQLAFAVDGTSYRLRPNHLTITRPWQRHRVGQPGVEASHLAWMILDVGVRRPNQPWNWPDWLVLTRSERDCLTALLRQNEQPVWKASASLAQYFHRLEQAAGGEGKRFDRTRMVLAINELLLAVLEMLSGRQIPMDDSFTSNERCVELFLAELPRAAGEAWTVDSMAEQCGLKRSRFTTCCRQLTNRSPAEYLAYCRVTEAARLLREQPKQSVAEIAYACGFSSSQHFATTFRAFNSVTPTEWRSSADGPRNAGKVLPAG